MIVVPTYPDLILPPSKSPRSKGVHVSNIIRSVGMHMNILTPDSLEDLKVISDTREITDPVAKRRICLGLAWEEFYIPRILAAEGVSDHPGELEYGGIYMSPDGDSVSIVLTSKQTKKRKIIHEVKATYKSCRVSNFATLKRDPIDISKQLLWMMQVKSYCKASGTRFVVLHVLFICGDYAMPITPELVRYHIEFTQEEIDNNWDMLMQHLKDVEGEQKPARKRLKSVR